MAPAAPLVVFPDAELWLTGYLRQALAGFAAEVPSPYVGIVLPERRRDFQVVVNQDGGLRRNVALATARMRIRCWAPTEEQAASFASLLEALVWASPHGDPVVSVQGVGRPSHLIDESGQPGRLQWIELLLRGADKEIS